MELAKSQLIKRTFSICDFPFPLYSCSLYVVNFFISDKGTHAQRNIKKVGFFPLLRDIHYEANNLYLLHINICTIAADRQSSRNTNRGGSGTDKILIYIIYI